MNQAKSGRVLTAMFLGLALAFAIALTCGTPPSAAQTQPLQARVWPSGDVRMPVDCGDSRGCGRAEIDGRHPVGKADVQLGSSRIWSTECLDCPRRFTDMTDRSLAVDANGDLYVAYGADHLYLAKNDGTGWAIEVVDGASQVGRFAAIALEPMPPYTAHIGYYDAANGDLKHAYWTTEGWLTETLDSDPDVGQYVSLALAATPPYTPHVSYNDATNGDLRHAWLTPGGWMTETVDADGWVGRYTSLALAATAPFTPYVSYHDSTNDALKIARRTAAGWAIETVDSTAWWSDGWSSLALAPTAPFTPHISYYSELPSVDGVIMHAWRTPTGWLTETVDRIGQLDEDVGQRTSLAIEPRAPYTAHIAYWCSWSSPHDDESLRHAWSTPTGWQSETVDTSSPSVGQHASLALESSAPYTPHVSYYDWSYPGLKHAELASGVWISETVDRSWGAGADASLALEPTAPYTAHVSYSASSGMECELRYLTWTPSLSTTELITKSAWVYCMGTTLALAPAWPYTAHVFYGLSDVLSSSADVVHSWRTPAGWLSEVVDPEGLADPEEEPPIAAALEATSPYTPHLCYPVGYSPYLLRHTWWTPSGWVSETVARDVSLEVSFALEPTAPHTPHVAYRDNATDALIHAWRTPDGWLSDTIDSGAGIGWYSSLALEPTAPHTAHISYFDHSHKDLRYAWRSPDGWVTVTLDAEADVGRYTSLALESTVPHTAHISYYAYTHGDVKHAWQTPTGWLTETVDSKGDVGWYNTSLALQQSAPHRPYIAYLDSSNSDLKLAWLSEETWTAVHLPLIMRGN